jgi:type III secretory pathway component EscV
MKKNNPSNKNINIELDESIAQGSYSNLVIVNHSPTEFVLDFINVMPGTPKAKVRSRIILTPEHVKKFIKALDENLNKFESSFGEIKNFKKEVFPISFGPNGEA